MASILMSMHFPHTHKNCLLAISKIILQIKLLAYTYYYQCFIIHLGTVAFTLFYTSNTPFTRYSFFRCIFSALSSLSRPVSIEIQQAFTGIISFFRRRSSQRASASRPILLYKSVSCPGGGPSQLPQWHGHPTVARSVRQWHGPSDSGTVRR